MDLQNRLEGATPLHLAVKLENEAARQGVIEMLLDAGADPRFVFPPFCRAVQVSPASADLPLPPFFSHNTLHCFSHRPRPRTHRIKDRHSSPLSAYLNPYSSAVDKAILGSINSAIAEFSLGGVDSADIAEDSDGEPGRGSGSGSEED